MAADLSGYLAGLVLSCEEIPKKEKLKKLSIDIGADDPVDIVTNAGNVGTRTVGCRVVVATVGASLSDGETVKKTTVGGVSSQGVLCDGPMLGWSGGGAGTAVLLPDTFNPGDQCPGTKPGRRDGENSTTDASAPVSKSTGPGVDALFEKKLSKDEKKAALAAKRAAKKAAKEGGDGAGEEADTQERNEG
jgi:tRNA-binding EMAP/Myf-like protein